MKFVLFSDLHLDSPFQWVPPAIGRKLRSGLRTTLERIVDLARQRRADAILCAGDLYEQQSFTPDTAEFLRAIFSAAEPIRVFIAPGNHDWYGPEALYSKVSWSENVHLFTESHLVPIQLSEDLMLWGAAHRAPANTSDFLAGTYVDGLSTNIALFHGSESSFLTAQGEGKAPHAPFYESEIERSGFRHAFVGHYHHPRDTAWLTYAGSPQPLAFGEGAGRAVLIEVDGNEIYRERIDVASIAFHDLTVNVSGAVSMTEILQRTHSAVAGLHGVARLTLTGSLGTSVDLVVDDIKGIVCELDAPPVVRVWDLQADYDFGTIAQEQTVRGQFVRDVQASELPTHEKQRVLQVGLRALDGRGDLEPV